MSALTLQNPAARFGLRAPSALRRKGAVCSPRAGRSMSLTRRGRLVFIGLPAMAAVLAILIGLSSWVSTMPAFASEQGQGVEKVTIMSGQSLWDIAQERVPEEDPRRVIDDIVSINHLDAAHLQPGQVIEVPVYAER